MSGLSPEEIIERLRHEGFLDEEIVEQFGLLKMGVRRHPTHLEFIHGGGSPMQQRRVMREWLADHPAATGSRHVATWRNADAWTEPDYIDRIAEDRALGGSGGYRSVAKRCEGVGATALLRRWQKVSGGKPWPSGRNAPLHRE